MTEATQFLEQHLSSVLKHRGPYPWAHDFEDYARSYFVRDTFIHEFGFAILDGETVELLVQLGPLLEVGAGTGYWSHELRKAGADVVATDLAPGERYHFAKIWGEVEALDGVSAVAKYPNRTLLLVWPDYQEPWSAEVLKAYTGKTVIYVGEGSGGCTGCEDFHAILDEQFKQRCSRRLPQFQGIHDRLEIFDRI